MDKLYIFNTALNVYNIDPLTETTMEDENNPVVATLDLHLNKAIHKAMRAADWTFLEQVVDIGESLGPKGGFSDSYQLPEGLFRITRVDTASSYRRVGSLLLMDGRATVYGMMEPIAEDGVPDDFWDLVAYALAFFASAKLSPGDKKSNTAMVSYDAILQGMLLNDVQSNLNDYMER